MTTKTDGVSAMSAELGAAMKRVHALGADHGPDGWPAVQMRDLIVLHSAVQELRAELRTQRYGIRAVIAAAVALVCDPEWEADTEEQATLEDALRSAGLVQPNTEAQRAAVGGPTGAQS